MRRVVITGVGVISPNGSGKTAYWAALKEGTSGLGIVTLFPPEKVQCQVVGEVKNLTYECLPPKDRRRVPRIVPIAILAAEEALQDSGILYNTLTEEERREIGVFIGTGGGGVDFSEREYERFFRGDPHVSAFAIVSSFVGMVSSEVSIHLGFRGPSHVLSTGCTSSTDAIGYAAGMIRNGQLKKVLAGGAEACITPGILTAFVQMGTTTVHWNHNPQGASRPFSMDRDGFILSEGAWMLVLESYESAVARNAPIYGEIAGYGSTCDAYHKTQIMPGGDESARAVQNALCDAKLGTDEIEYINLHGTATRMNDEIETIAVRKVFGERAGRIPASSTKSMIGHPQGACGAAGVVAALLALNESVIHPTINLDHPDPACDLDYVPNVARKQSVRTALCNCIAFGSKNSALVLKRID